MVTSSAFPDDLTAAKALHERIVEVHRIAARADADLARLLHECWNSRAYRVLGFATRDDYCASFGLGYEKARVLARLGSRFEELPQLEAAMREGVAWTKLREVQKVLVPENADAWMAFASEHPQRLVTAAVRHSDVGELPPPADEVRRQVRVRKCFEMAADQAEIVEQALLAEQLRAGVSLEDFDSGAALAAWARRSLDESSGDGDVLPTAAGQSLLFYCPQCAACWSPKHEVDETMARRALDDTEIVDLVQDEKSAEVADMLMGKPAGSSRPSTAVRASIPPIVRKATLQRDGMRCRVPGCSCRAYLQLHHILHVVDGGGRDSGNLVWLCTAHHSMHHNGKLRIEGDADGELRFTFPDGRQGTSQPPLPRATAAVRTTRGAEVSTPERAEDTPEG